MSPFSRAAAERNKRVLNRVLRPLARVAPGMGLLTHTGRRSGRQYTIPLLVFVRQGHYLIALTYGSQADWVRNVITAEGAGLHSGRRRVRLGQPLIRSDPDHTWAPWLIRVILRRIQADQVMVFAAAHPPPRRRCSRRALPR